MLEVVEGKGVGSGKSAFVIERLMELWLAGGTSYCSDSFVVLWDKCKEYAERYHGLILQDDQHNTVSAEHIKRIHEHTPPGTEDNPVLIVIDEAQDQFDVREHADKSKNDVFKWACQSRHDDNDLIFITQNVKNIDARIRRIATYIWSVRNSRFHAVQGIGNTAATIRLFTLGLNDGWYFIRTQLDAYDGRTVMQKIWKKADKRLLACYRSKAMSGKRDRGGARVPEKQLERVKTSRNPNMVKWVFLVGAVICITSVVTMCRSGGPLGGIGDTAVKASSSSGSSGRPAEAARATPAAAAGPEIRSEKWLTRTPGFLRTEGGTYETGKICKDGFVEAIQDGTARIRKANGQLLYVVGADYVVPAGPAPAATPQPSRGIIVAPAPTVSPLDGGATWNKP